MVAGKHRLKYAWATPNYCGPITAIPRPEYQILKRKIYRAVYIVVNYVRERQYVYGPLIFHLPELIPQDFYSNFLTPTGAPRYSKNVQWAAETRGNIPLRNVKTANSLRNYKCLSLYPGVSSSTCFWIFHRRLYIIVMQIHHPRCGVCDSDLRPAFWEAARSEASGWDVCSSI